jgi:hypothetical protein
MRESLLEAFLRTAEQLRKIIQNAYNDRPVTVCLSDLRLDRPRNNEACKMNENSVMERL